VLVLDAGSVVVIDGRQAASPPQRAMIRRAQRFGRVGSARQEKI